LTRKRVATYLNGPKKNCPKDGQKARWPKSTHFSDNADAAVRSLDHADVIATVTCNVTTAGVMSYWCKTPIAKRAAVRVSSGNWG